MEKTSFFTGIKQEVKSFFGAVSKANETVYLVLLTLYVIIYLILKVFWNSNADGIVATIKYTLLGVVMWGAAVYLFFVIAEWKSLWNETIWLILVGVAILAATYFFSKKMSTNSYEVVMDIFFCMMACGKDYKKILRCILCVTVAMLIIAGIGMPLGFTSDVGKPDTSVPGHSLGIEYPNSWGYLVFLALALLWYLYIRFKPALTFIVFWAVSAFMYSYITCRTIAGITIIFPFLALVVNFIEKRIDRKVGEGTFYGNKPLRWIVTAIPYLAFAFMMFSSMQVDWWYKYYHGPLRNLAWRFLMGGLYFRTYGIPVFGNPYRSNVYTYINVQGEFIKVGILDSSFAAYLIMRGAVWMAYTLLWLCIAHWKALKKRDYAIILIGTIMLGFAMMERPGLDMWYNFILLYPLAKVISKPGTEDVLEFAGVVEPEHHGDTGEMPSHEDSSDVPEMRADDEKEQLSDLDTSVAMEPVTDEGIEPEIVDLDTTVETGPKEEDTE